MLATLLALQLPSPFVVCVPTICADAPLTASRIFSRRVTLDASCGTLVNAP